MELPLVKKILKTTWIKVLLKEKVFTISLMLAIATSLVTMPKISYINFNVILCLFNLMLVVSAFEELKLMDKAAITILNKCTNLRYISLIMIALTFVSSMLVTNDVALITFIPLTLIISRKLNVDPLEIIIMQTLAANIGSSLTPMGNPQNLFLFTFYKISAAQFFKIMIPFVFMGALWLIILNLKVSKKVFNLQLDDISITDKRQALLFGVLFLVIILSIFNIVDYKLAFGLTLAVALRTNKKLFKRVDFFLLVTFICFFIFVGNISHFEIVNSYLHNILSTENKTFFTSIALSQFISNVPASILVANFTDNWKQVLLGVNIGGMGTLIASLASVISYKLYVNSEQAKRPSHYMTKFTLYNILGLIIFTVIIFILLNNNLI